MLITKLALENSLLPENVLPLLKNPSLHQLSCPENNDFSTDQRQ